MKTEQKEKAKEMYFQDGMTKTAIAGKLGVARKTVLFWASQGNWDQLKRSAQHTPALVAEKCYYLIDQFASRLLVDNVGYAGLSLKDAQTLHLLASTIKKIKTRSATNESMELFQFFLAGLHRRDPALAEQVKPQIEEYISIRSDARVTDFLLDGFNEDGSLPYPETELAEAEEDRKGNLDLAWDFELFMRAREEAKMKEEAAAGQPAPAAPTSEHAERTAA